jgi:hypothetical protein
LWEARPGTTPCEDSAEAKVDLRSSRRPAWRSADRSAERETSERALGAEFEKARSASSGPGKRESARARRPGDGGAEARRRSRSDTARSGRRRRARRETARENSGREVWRRGSSWMESAEETREWMRAGSVSRRMASWRSSTEERVALGAAGLEAEPEVDEGSTSGRAEKARRRRPEAAARGCAARRRRSRMDAMVGLGPIFLALRFFSHSVVTRQSLLGFGAKVVGVADFLEKKINLIVVFVDSSQSKASFQRTHRTDASIIHAFQILLLTQGGVWFTFLIVLRLQCKVIRIQCLF